MYVHSVDTYMLLTLPKGRLRKILANTFRVYCNIPLKLTEINLTLTRNGTLDLLIADTPILDYYRATDHGCKLQRIGDQSLAEDTYAIGMAKGFPLKVILELFLKQF